MSLEAVIGIGVVAAVVVVFGVAFYMDDQRRARRKLREPPVKVAAAVPGKALKVSGRARPRSALTVTLRGEPCVYVRIALLHFFRKEGSDGAVSESWREVLEEERGGPFEIADASGAAVVDPAGAITLLEADWTDLDWNALGTGEADLVKRHESAVTRGAPAKIRQVIVRENQTISVFGTPQEQADDPALLFAAGKKTLLALGS